MDAMKNEVKEEEEEIQMEEVLKCEDKNDLENQETQVDVQIHQYLETSMPTMMEHGNGKRQCGSFECRTCGKMLKSQKSLVRHNSVQHKILIEKVKRSYGCLVCQEKFSKWNDLLVHRKHTQHHGKIECKECRKFFSPSYMNEHRYHHSGEKPYLCVLCGRSYAQISAFYKHKKVCLNEEKKLQCSYCEKRFYEKFQLKEHERIHTKEKPFICETCGKAFRRKNKLVIHQLSHTGTKPHECSVCGRTFRQRIHLTEHMRIHSGIKPFHCDICGSSFTQGHSLKTHRLKHK